MKVINEGIVFGKTYFTENKDVIIHNKKKITVDDEITIFQNSKNSLIKMLQEKEEINPFLNWQVLLLNDPYLNEDILTFIKDEKLSACEAVLKVFSSYLNKSKLNGDDEFFKSRFDEIINLGYNLASVIKGDLNNCPIFLDNKILVANRLFPTDLMYYDLKKVTAIILNKISEFEHLAILCSHLDIVLIEMDISLIKDNTFYILDTNKGIITADLTYKLDDVIKEVEYKRYKTTNEFRLDGNISVVDDIKIAIKNEIKNIGLVRTEGIITNLNSYLEQLELYKEINNSFDRVCYRIFDFTSDKFINNDFKIENLKSFIKQKDLLYTQLKAIINSSSNDKIIYIIVPKVKRLKDLIKIKMIINDINYKGDKTIQLGAMIESKIKIRSLNEIVKYSDFISIGTNDLVGNVLNKSREDVTIEDYMTKRFRVNLKKILKVCEFNKKRATICGNIASNLNMLDSLINDYKVKGLSVVPSKYKEINDSLERII